MKQRHSKKSKWIHQMFGNKDFEKHAKSHGWSPDYTSQVKKRSEAVEKQRERARSFSVMRAGGLASRRARSSGLV